MRVGFVPGTGRVAPFNDVFKGGIDLSVAGLSALSHVDALLLWGGEDISPSLYNQKVGPAQADARPSERDCFEWEAMRLAVQQDKPIIGICRGAQIATVFAGGSLIQDVSGHTRGDHVLMTTDGKMFTCNSLHHQMMNPYNLRKEEFEVLAWTSNRASTRYLGENHEEVMVGTIPFSSYVEPEVVYYPKIRALCIQSHPEWMNLESPFVKWCVDKVSNLFVVEQEC